MEAGSLLLKLLEKPLFWELLALAALVLLLNVVLHAFKEIFTARYAKSRVDHQTIAYEARVLLAATEALVARLVEMLVHTGSRLQETDWEDLIVAPASPAGLNRRQTTALRFLTFLVACERFRQRTADLSSPRLDAIRFYIERKIPTSLKGNIFGQEILSGEEARFLGRYFTDGDAQVDSTPFTAIQRMEQELARDLFNRLGRAINVTPASLENLKESSGTGLGQAERRTLAVTHMAILLLDLHQDVAWSPHWEENRLVLCQLLRDYNKTRSKEAFLYAIGDLSTPSYISTFHMATFANKRWPNWLRLIFARRQLRRRGRIAGESHPVKHVHAEGVNAKMPNGSAVALRWNNATAALSQQQLNAFLRSTRKIVRLPGEKE